MRSIYWVRNDLRLHDNLALQHFYKTSQEGFIIWCPNASYLRAGELRKEFIDQSIFHFSHSFQPETIYRGDKSFSELLPEILSEYSIDQIIFTREFTVEEGLEEDRVFEICKRNHIKVIAFDQSTLLKEDDLPFSLKEMPKIFTNFRKKIEENLKIQTPIDLKIVSLIPLEINLPSVHKVNLVTSDKCLVIKPGEKEALLRLHYYFSENHFVKNYKITRNGLLNFDDSTKFSPYLNLGSLSPRKIFYELKKYESIFGANESTYWVFFELLWRDYFKFLSRIIKEKLYLQSGLNGNIISISPESIKKFETWKKGETDHPFINANMNELNNTGWMSNRGRQNVASFLIHQLQVPWTWGASYFEEMLLDYDPDLNWGNWLYLSGNGTDPRSRVFNPQRQAEQYDQTGQYQKKWGNE